MSARTSVHQGIHAAQRRAEDDDRNVVTNETQTFKKPYQEVNRPAVTDHDINDEYMRDPPNNLARDDSVPTTDRKTRGLKEGAQEETDPKQEGVLGDEPTGRIKKDAVLGSVVNENSQHP